MLYIQVCLSRSRLCHALFPLLACACRSLGPLACVVTFVPPRACLDVTTYEIHLPGVGVLDTPLSPICMMLICLPCLLCATLFTFFASLHLCTLAYMFMHESVCRPHSNLMELWTLNPNLHFSSLDTTFLLVNMFVCPFMCITCLFAPICHLLLACLLAYFPSICFFACLPACFFFHCMYMRGAWTLGAMVRPLRWKQKGQGCKQEDASP